MAGALVAAVLLGQALLGGPFTRHLTVKIAPAPEIGPGVYQGKMPSAWPTLDWHAPLVRVSVDGRKFAPCKGNEQLLRAAFPASRVKGRVVLLHTSPETPLPPVCEVITPWLPSAGAAAWLAILLAGLGGGLLWARPPALRRWTGLLQRLPVMSWLLASVLAGAVFIRVFGFAYPSWENDSDDYFRPVFQWLSGQPVGPTDRPLGYPLVIAGALRLFLDLRALTWLQMAASLCAGVAMAGVLLAATRRLWRSVPMRAAARVACLGCVALFLFNERVLQREWFLLPEAIGSLWLAIQLWLAWRMMTHPLRRTGTLVEFGCLCAAGWAFFFTKSNWGFALAMLPLPMLVATLLGCATWPERARWCAAGTGVLLLVTGLAIGFQKATPANTQASLEIRSRVLVCWHLPLVRLEIARRLAEQPANPEAALLSELATVLDAELALAKLHGPGAYPSLGYDADRLYYYGFQKAALYARLSPAQRSAFCRGLFLAALQRHPSIYLRKVCDQMAIYFRDPYAPAILQFPHVLSSLERSERWLAQPPPYLPAALQESYRPVLAAARAALQGPWPSPVRASLALRIDALLEPLNPLFAWLLGVPMLLLVAAATWRRWRVAIPWRELAPVLGLAFWATGSAVLCALSSSVLQALEIQRYVDLFLPLTLLSEFLWPLIALSLLSALAASRQATAVS